MTGDSLRGTSQRIKRRMQYNHPQTPSLYPAYQAEDGPRSTLKDTPGRARCKYLRSSKHSRTQFALPESGAPASSDGDCPPASDTVPRQGESTWAQRPRSRPSPAGARLQSNRGPHAPGGRRRVPRGHAVRRCSGCFQPHGTVPRSRLAGGGELGLTVSGTPPRTSSVQNTGAPSARSRLLLFPRKPQTRLRPLTLISPPPAPAQSKESLGPVRKRAGWGGTRSGRRG